MSDPPLSDIDFKNKMARVWTTLNFSSQNTVLQLFTVFQPKIVTLECGALESNQFDF